LIARPFESNLGSEALQKSRESLDLALDKTFDTYPGTPAELDAFLLPLGRFRWKVK
jgi:hypothetical protein